jgi:hypothetical protein
MQQISFRTAIPQLLHHVVEVAPQISDFIVSPGEANRDIQIAFTYLRDLFLQLNHGPLHKMGEP